MIASTRRVPGPQWLAWIGLLLLGWWFGLHIAQGDLPTLITRHLHDDAFYYFEIAHRLGQTGRSTFDGTILANGYHPLWMVIITPIFRTLPDLLTPLYQMQAINLLILLIAATLFGRLLRALGVSPAVSLAASALLFANPAFIIQSMNGLETALVIMLTLAWLNWHVRITRQATISAGDGLTWGALAALAFLARTDTAPLIVIGVVMLLVRFRRTLWPTVRALIPGGLLAVVMVAPWLGWNMIHFGSPIQSSGMALTALGYAGETQPLLGRIIASMSLWRIFGYHAGLTVPWILAAGGIIGLAVLLSLRDSLASARDLLAPIWPVILWAPAFITMHAAIRLSVRPWYFVSVVPLLMIGLGITLELASRAIKARMPGWVSTLILLALVPGALIPGLIFTQSYGDPDQLVMYEGTQWLDQHMPEGLALGILNSGIAAYTVERPVVNLDGVVNHEVIPYLVAGNGIDYLEMRGICYVGDFAESLDIVAGDDTLAGRGFEVIHSEPALRGRAWLAYTAQDGAAWTCR